MGGFLSALMVILTMVSSQPKLGQIYSRNLLDVGYYTMIGDEIAILDNPRYK